ncbi:MAG: hypothetical protein WD294_07490 [Phycisphaeraceae bacterium]
MWQDNPRKTGIMLLITLLALGAGVYLILDYRATIPPDPANDDPETVIAFLLSDYHDRLSPTEQQRYVEQMLERYRTMDEKQRERVDAAVAAQREADGERLQNRMVEMWKTYVVSEAEQYVQLELHERQAWLQGRMAVWRAMGGGPPRGDRDRGSRNVADELTDERQREVLGFFQKEILPRSTARERALVSIMARDVMEMR